MSSRGQVKHVAVVEEQGTSQLRIFVRALDEVRSCEGNTSAAVSADERHWATRELCRTQRASRHLSALYSPRLNSPPRVAAPAMMGNACAGGGAVLLYRVWLNIVGELPPAGSM